SRSITTAAGPSDLKAPSTITGFGFSMKCAPSCRPMRRSRFSSRMCVRIAARRSAKFMGDLKLLQASRVTEVGILEHLLELAFFADHALLVHVALDCFEVLAVGGRQSELPGIAAENLLLLLDRGAHPGERHHAWVLHPAIGHLLALFKR